MLDALPTIPTLPTLPNLSGGDTTSGNGDQGLGSINVGGLTIGSDSTPPYVWLVAMALIALWIFKK